MTDIVLLPITNSANVSVVNDNNAKIQQSINEDILHLSGGNNTMLQQLDMNSNKIINIQTDPNDPDSMVTVGAGDSRWYNVAGDSLTGTMNAGGQRIINLPVPVGATEPVRKGEYDSQVSNLVSTDNVNKLQSVRGQDGEQLTPLPPAGSRANKVMGFDALGNPLGILPASGSGTELAIDLANAADVNKGSNLVGFYDPISPAYLKTVSDIINMEPVSVLRLVPRGAETTALHNGTSTFPLAAPINALIQDMNAVGGGHIELTYAKHMLESYIQYLSNIKMTGLGDASIFKGMFASSINRMLTSPALVGQSNIILKDFKVDRTGVNTEHGVILGGIDGLTIDNVTVWGFRPEVTSGAMGISPFNEFATIQSKNVDVMNCKIVQPNNFGIAYGNVSGGTLTKNLFTDAWREAIGLETWGETSVVEDIVVSHNILRMSTRPGNHFGGSVGPAVLVGGAGASYAGLTRRCTLSHNIIYIDNAGGLSDYRGIVAVGGPAEATAVEDITLDTNTIHGAVGSGIAYGAAGSVTRRIHSRNNDIHNPNTGLNTGARGAALNVRYATDCTSKGDTVTGNTHTYAVYEDVGSLRNKFTEVDCGSPTVGVFHRNSDTSIFTKVGADQSTGGARFQEFVTIAAGQTVALSNRANPNRGSYRFEFSSGSYAHIHVVGAIAPVVISKSGDVYVAAVDSEANTQAFTIFPISNAALAVTNRTALDRTFVVESLCAV